MQQELSIHDLKRRVIAELDRELGPRGTIIDLDIERLPGAQGPNWGISRISEDSFGNALEESLRRVLPDLRLRYRLADKSDPRAVRAMEGRRDLPPLYWALGVIALIGLYHYTTHRR